ncbi:hypothetical protein O4215_20475 [Rhodococcus maanshanensis]|uniref:hypothetical protein n=1 Tax=Rhodococcus maanshanensis TaxID=183556 RepID=UPI0022B555C6|nr:hypothetical protein [Rhodococcus maanshanensis]MCZ4557940.1 hypothetical protein [Rhodococcus maanshanensis]
MTPTRLECLADAIESGDIPRPWIESEHEECDAHGACPTCYPLAITPPPTEEYLAA